MIKEFKGDWHSSTMVRGIYSQDASIYQETPLAVVFPKDKEDLIALLKYALNNKTSLIPRTAGTSLAGQCVGSGIVVDLSKYFTETLTVNPSDKTVWVQPGVIRDELNRSMAKHGLFFGPNTSTSNRAMIGGMLGNNSCGSTSVRYGTTRDYVLEIEGILSDGSVIHCKELSRDEFHEKCQLNSLEGQLYRYLNEILSNIDMKKEINEQYPKPEINRRNTGYALDLLARMQPFEQEGKPFNLCSLICGSEGTLVLATAIKLQLQELPPASCKLICAHFKSIDEAMTATVAVMQNKPYACELMDDQVLSGIEGLPKYEHMAEFIMGKPKALLMIEVRGMDEKQSLEEEVKMLQTLTETKSYYNVSLTGTKMKDAWELRAAGLGLLANTDTEEEAINCIEDTAVALADLPAYIREFEQMMHAFGQTPVYYAHAGDGELHLKPRINLHTEEGIQKFKAICEASAKLVKKYKGSLSGEHGDGRVRGSFIPMMLGPIVYDALIRLKSTIDPLNILNPGKIVNVPDIDNNIRQKKAQGVENFWQKFDYTSIHALVASAEKCSGSGDCRKLPDAGGTMCPSYHATLDEKHNTRGRARALQQLLANPAEVNFMVMDEITDAMSLCISCKGCTSECPSQVDMSAMKAAWQYQYRKQKGENVSDWLVGHFDKISSFGSLMPTVYNYFMSNSIISSFMKKMAGIDQRRSLPLLETQSLRKWFKGHSQKTDQNQYDEKVILFCDEFTDSFDVKIGIKTVEVLNFFGIGVLLPKHKSSGRALISKGYMDEVMTLAKINTELFSTDAFNKYDVVGIEPSAILTLKDEYPRLLRTASSEALAMRSCLIDEFLFNQIQKGKIKFDIKRKIAEKLVFHGHCHQKALADVNASLFLLSELGGKEVQLIPSGCCGMAGSFGYMKNTFDISNQIAELVLFPELRRNPEAIIVANGTSCRHQIADGLNKKSLHLIEVIHYCIGMSELD